MANLRMAEKLTAGEAIDVSRHRQEDGTYLLPDFVEDTDYCDAATERWIWSIGREAATGAIRASTSTQYYQNPAYECLFLR
jgi:hypothetical protein